MNIQDESGVNQVWNFSWAGNSYRQLLRSEVILRNLPKTEKYSVLEIGPGTGVLTQLLVKKKLMITAIDQSKFFITQLRENKYLSDVTFINKEACLFLKENSLQYSAIVGIGILHHLWHDSNWTKKLYSNLDTNGIIVFIEPNPENIIARFIFNTDLGRKLFKLDPKEKLKKTTDIKKELLTYFNSIRIVQVDLNYPFFPKILMRLLTYIEKFLPKKFKKKICQSIAIVAQRKN